MSRWFQPLKENKFRIPKSRYDSVDLYISDEWMNRPEYNDTDAPYDSCIYDRLRKHGESPGLLLRLVCLLTFQSSPPGLDDLLSKHISHLFIRDPIVIFSEMIDLDDNASTDHFEVRPPSAFASST